MAGLWDLIVVLFAGKKVAILGQREAGKTTLYDYLEHGTVATDSPRLQTVGPTKRGVARRKELKLAIKTGTDIPGDETYYPDWHQIFSSADIVFYVFDAHRARTDPAYAARISRDGKEIKSWGIKGKDRLHSRHP